RHEPAAPPGIRRPPAWRQLPARSHAARRPKARPGAGGDRWRQGRREWIEGCENPPFSAINGAIPPPRRPGYAARIGQSVGSLAAFFPKTFQRQRTIEQNKNNAKMVSRRGDAFHSSSLANS